MDEGDWGYFRDTYMRNNGNRRWGDEGKEWRDSYFVRSRFWRNEEEAYLMGMYGGWIYEEGLSEAAKATVRCCYYPKPERGDPGKLIEGIVKAVYQMENRRGWDSRDELERELARHRMHPEPKAAYCIDFPKVTGCWHGDECKYFHAK